MWTVETIPGKTYAVECVGEVVVTNTETGAVVAQGDGSGQVLFTACGSSYTVSDDAAKVVELFKSAPGSNVAPGAIAAAQVAAREAKEAAVRAEDAAEAVEGAAQVGANNTFEATNTFSGALVANGSLFYGQLELGDLLTYPVITRLMEAGINPASALATTWDEWVALNPDWDSLEHVIFYAPLITGTLQLSGSPTTIPPNKKCTFISPANANNTGSAYFLRRHLKYYTLESGDNADVYNCYYMIDCAFYAPNATKLTSALNAIGWNTTQLSLSVFIPSVTTINNDNNINDTFHRMGLLASFNIYAPKLVSSFSFSRMTNSGKGQTCAILQALIAGIGTPDTLQTITTITPSDGDEVQTVDEVEKTKKDILRKEAATKNWKFIIPAKDDEGNDITIDL